MSKEIIKIKSKPTAPDYDDWDIEVYVCNGDLECVESVAEMIAAFKAEGITDPSKMLFTYTAEHRSYYDDWEDSTHTFYYRKKGFEEALEAYDKDLSAWQNWKMDNKDAIAAENKRKLQQGKRNTVAKNKRKLKKEIAATEAKLSKLNGELNVHPVSENGGSNEQ